MSEQPSLEAFMAKLERRFRRQKKLRELGLQLAISLACTSPHAAQAVYENTHNTDALPHD